MRATTDKDRMAAAVDEAWFVFERQLGKKALRVSEWVKRP